MKFVVNSLLIFLIIIKKVFLFSSLYYKNSDLIINFTNDFIKKFHSNQDFIRFTNDLKDDIKLRIKEKLINSFVVRIEREKNAREYLKKLKTKNVQDLNFSEIFSFNKTNNKDYLSDQYFEIFESFKEYSNYSKYNDLNNENLSRSMVDVETISKININKTNLKYNSIDIKKNNTLNPLKTKKDLINLLNNIKSPKKFVDFTNVFLDSEEEFQTKFNEREIIQYLKKLDNSKSNKNNSLLIQNNTFIKRNNNNYIKNNKNKTSIYEKSFRTNRFFINREHNNKTKKQAVDKSQNIKKKTKISGNKKISNKEFLNINLIDVKYEMVEPKVKSRKIQFFIDFENECDIYINDTVKYEYNKNLNMIDHMILHNDVNRIDPRSINSNTKDINYFIYNKPLNMFSIDFQNKDSQEEKDFEINYQYMADNLIKNTEIISKNKTKLSNKTVISYKSNFLKEIKNITSLNENYLNTDGLVLNEDFEDGFWNKIQNFHIIDNNITSIFLGNLNIKNDKSDKIIRKFNEFVWKINNENIGQNIDVELEFLFFLGDDFDYNKIKFNFKTKKFTKTISEKIFRVFTWNGILLPYEVKNIKCAFPLAFETCGKNIKYDISVLMILFLFFFFLLLIIYLIFRITFKKLR